MADVSIVVPIYGVEKFIERCAVSLFEQTYKSIEFVFVNDQTPDDSITILKKIIGRYPDRANDIRIIDHEKNRGLAAARNTGLEHANGTFILHVDSDDYLDLNTIESLYKKAITDNSDIVACNFLLEWDSVSKVARQNIGNSKHEMLCLMLRAETMVGLVNKLIKKSLYIDNHIRAIEGINLGEDFVTTPKLVYFANKVSHVDLPLYHYMQTNANSYTKNYSKKNIDNVIQVLDELTSFFAKNKNQEFDKALLQGKLRKKIELLFATDTEYWDYLSQIFPDTDNLSDTSFLTFREKIINTFRRMKRKSLFYMYRDGYQHIFRIVQKIKGR